MKFRTFATENMLSNKGSKFLWAGAAIIAAGFLVNECISAEAVDYKNLRQDIEDLIDTAIKKTPVFDDGSYGPLFVRLAWHSAGSYSRHDRTGGSNGANMRFHPESGHGANAGLHIARDLLETLKKKYPGISYSDLYTFAGVVAIESMGGPEIRWRSGRSDTPCVAHVKPTPHDRLPDASQGAQHLRDIFYRMGFNDKDIVALSGAHCLGRCHTDRSGFSGPWTNSPTSFNNAYYTELLENKWTEKKWQGPKQFEDPTGQLMMLPSDLALIQDPAFKKYVELYAKDQDAFFNDFASAFSRLLELGVDFPSPSEGHLLRKALN